MPLNGREIFRAIYTTCESHPQTTSKFQSVQIQNNLHFSEQYQKLDFSTGYSGFYIISKETSMPSNSEDMNKCMCEGRFKNKK